MALIPQKIIDLLNYRIDQEEQSSRIYKAMQNWLNINGYEGASKLWSKYSIEELEHAQWAYNHLLELNILPTTPSQDQPQLQFRNLPQIIALSYQHEVEVKDQCVELSKTCLELGDMLTFTLAQRYVDEQRQEINKMQLWIDKLESFGTDNVALRWLDAEMIKYAK